MQSLQEAVETGLAILTELRETLGIPVGTSSSSTEPVPDVGETNNLAALLELDPMHHLQEISYASMTLIKRDDWDTCRPITLTLPPYSVGDPPHKSRGNTDLP